MQANLDRLGGLVHSQRVLLALTQKGVSREDAYRLVQRNAMQVWQEGSDFLDLLEDDPEVCSAILGSGDSRRCSTSATTSSTSTRSSPGSSANTRLSCNDPARLSASAAHQSSRSPDHAHSSDRRRPCRRRRPGAIGASCPDPRGTAAYGDGAHVDRLIRSVPETTRPLSGKRHGRPSSGRLPANARSSPRRSTAPAR